MTEGGFVTDKALITNHCLCNLQLDRTVLSTFTPSRQLGALSFVLKIRITASKSFCSTSPLQTAEDFTKEIITAYTDGNWGWENPNHSRCCSGTGCGESQFGVLHIVFYCHLMPLMTLKCHHHPPRLQRSCLPKALANDKDCWRGLNVTEQPFGCKSSACPTIAPRSLLFLVIITK